MATITSAQNGNWEDGTTWVGGVVPNPEMDDVTIATGHTVQISSALTFSTTTTIHSGATLKVGDKTADIYGAIFLDGCVFTGEGTLSMGKGAFHSTNTSWNYIRVAKFIAADANPLVYRSYDLRKLSFIGCTEVHIKEGRNAHDGQNPLCVIENCVFKECVNILFGESGWGSFSNKIDLLRVTVLDCDLILPAYPVSYTQCVVYSTRTETKKLTENKFNGLPVTITESALLNCHTWAWDTFTVRNSYFGGEIDGGKGGYISGYSSRKELESAFENNIVFSAESNVNNRAVNHSNVRNCFIEDISPASSASNTVFIPRNFNTCNLENNVIRAYNPFSALADTLEEFMPNYRITNNTAIHDSGFFWIEHNDPFPEGSLVTAKNNISICNNADSHNFFSTGHGFAGPLNIALDYNQRFNNRGWYDDTIYTNTLSGAHNVVQADATFPNFVDPTRNMGTWAQTHVSGTSYLDVWSYLQNLNGYDAATESHSASPLSATTIADMHTWLMAGYVPQNMELATAGEGGTFVGALMPQEAVSPPEKPDTPQPTSKAFYPIHVANIDQSHVHLTTPSAIAGTLQIDLTYTRQ